MLNFSTFFFAPRFFSSTDFKTSNNRQCKSQRGCGLLSYYYYYCYYFCIIMRNEYGAPPCTTILEIYRIFSFLEVYKLQVWHWIDFNSGVYLKVLSHHYYSYRYQCLSKLDISKCFRRSTFEFCVIFLKENCWC